MIIHPFQTSTSSTLLSLSTFTKSILYSNTSSALTRYKARCQAELFLDRKVVPMLRQTVGVHAGTVLVEEIDLGKYRMYVCIWIIFVRAMSSGWCYKQRHFWLLLP